MKVFTLLVAVGLVMHVWLANRLGTAPAAAVTALHVTAAAIGTRRWHPRRR